MADLVLACGCKTRFIDGEPPACATHGPQRVVRTVGMPRPRFRGVATGPTVTPMDLPAFTGRIAGSESHHG